MTENEFLLQDRIAKIRSIDKLYDLEHNGYVSYSGGKDSTVLSELIDLALPGNKIPRVYVNTGIEYKLMVEYVHNKMKEDERIVEILPKVNIRNMLEEKGYPFKSKEYSQKLRTYQNVGMSKTVTDYLGITGNKVKTFQCPEKLKYQFSPDFKLKVSDNCCTALKKKPVEEYEALHHRHIRMTGMRAAEGGLRKSHQECVIFDGDVVTKFHPLKPLKADFIDWFIDKYDIKLCELYYEPYNFVRTGCVLCPYNQKLRDDMIKVKKLLPTEYKKAEIIWGKVYDEYRRVGYRLNKNPYTK